MKNAISNIISAVSLWAVLVFVNLAFVGKVFAYEYEFAFDILDTAYSLVGVVWVSWMLSLLNNREKNPSRYVVYLLATLLVIPFCSVYAVANLPLWNLIYVLLSFSIICIFLTSTKGIRVPSLGREFVVLFGFVSLGITLYVYASLIVSGGLARFSLDLNEVYQARSEYLGGGRFFLSPYLVPWQANVLNMAALTLGLYEKRKAWVGGAIAAQVLLFALTNFKSFLFGPILVYFVVRFVVSNRLFVYLAAGASSAVMFFYGYYITFDSVLLPAIFIRRLFVVPSIIHSYYFDFFSTHPHVALSNSVLSWLFEYPYHLSITRVISWEYFNSDFGPNVGFIGDAYAHFGLLGVLVFSVVLALCLKLIDSLSRDVPVPVTAGVIALPVMALVNSALLTTLLTHGLMLSVVLLWCLRVVYKRRGLKESGLAWRPTQQKVGL